jgi:putative flippase GtrA
MQIIKKYRFFLIFSLIGGLCVFIDYGLYLWSIKLIKLTFVSKILSSLVSISVNYLLNSRFNFYNKQKIQAKYYLAYIAMYSLLILVNALFNMLFIKLTDNIKIAFWLAAVIAAFMNYYSVKIFFKKINDPRIIH